MHEIFFLSDILLTSCYFTCTCLVLEISLFGSNLVKHIVLFVVKFSIFGIQIHIWIGSAHHERIRKVPRRTRNKFRIPNLIVKVETGIVTRVSYRHYLKIVGNNKLWPDMQKESWNIHLTKIVICTHTLNGTDS